MLLDLLVIGLLLFLYAFAVTFGIFSAKALISRFKNRRVVH